MTMPYQENIAALRNFTKNDNLIITPWNKAGGVIIMDFTQYDEKYNVLAVFGN